MHLKMSAKWWPFCFGFNLLNFKNLLQNFPGANVFNTHFVLLCSIMHVSGENPACINNHLIEGDLTEAGTKLQQN